MARRTRAPLNVFLNGRLVGRLRRESSGAVDFRYDQTWLDWRAAFPVSLSLPLREDRYIGATVLAVFDNLLPDDDGIRRKLAVRSDADGADAYSLLSAIGRDCVGALQFLPDGEEPGHIGEIAGRVVREEEVAAILGDLARSPLGIGNDQELHFAGGYAGKNCTALLERSVVFAARHDADHAHSQASDRQVAQRHRLIEQRGERTFLSRIGVGARAAHG